ncbi:MAG: hypothetical protein LAN84_07155 [Acidobacteriia bacterium]|nr:hypothetical protein [Terriglobia bacterium]
MKSKSESEEESTGSGAGGKQENVAIATEPSARAPEALRELVERFQVCWEALPDSYYVRKEKRQIGFTLELTGTHEAGVEHPLPGCPHCHKVRIALQAIADWIMPKERRDSGYDIVPYDQSIQYEAVRKFRPDVSLRIQIQHRSGFDRPVDACEVRCLNEMKQRLKELGAREKKW